MKKFLNFILILLFSTVGLVLLLSEQLGHEFDLGKFVLVKTAGLAMLFTAMRIGKRLQM